MADAMDSKSIEGNLMRVQVPPPALQSILRELNWSEVNLMR